MNFEAGKNTGFALTTQLTYWFFMLSILKEKNDQKLKASYLTVHQYFMNNGEQNMQRNNETPNSKHLLTT